MRYIELSEKRRGGVELNPKGDVFSTIGKYVNRFDYYMSYTVINKLGINPRSGYETPIGIYSYPIVDAIVNPIMRSKDLSKAPFMGDAPYIWIFKPKDTTRGLYISDYSSSNYEGDIKKLFGYMSSRDGRFTVDAFDRVEEFTRGDAKINSPSGWIWNLTRILSRILSGDDSLSRYTVGVLRIGDRVRYIGSDSDHAGKVGVIVDLYPEHNEYGINFGDGDWDIKFDDVEPISVVEGIVLEYDALSRRAKKSSIIWTHLLYRVLGYEFVDDSDGSGLIHANEPYQAVFFNSSVIETIERLDNPSGSDDYTNTTTITKVFSNLKSTLAVERIDPKIVSNLLKNELKQIGANGSISSRIPVKFMGHVVVPSSRLQAALILADFNMVDYLKNISSDAINIMDRVYLKRIAALDTSEPNVITRITPIWRYFRLFHGDGWDGGERSIIDKAINSDNVGLIISYITNVDRGLVKDKRISDFILSNPQYITRYSMLMRSRWVEGERVLLQLPSDSWTVKEYLEAHRIEYSDLGKL